MINNKTNHMSFLNVRSIMDSLSSNRTLFLFKYMGKYILMCV